MGEGATVPVKRGRAYQELLAANRECRRPLRLPREGRREGQAGGERRADGAEAGRRHPAGRPPSAVHGGRAPAGGRGGLTAPNSAARRVSTCEQVSLQILAVSGSGDESWTGQHDVTRLFGRPLSPKAAFLASQPLSCG